MHHKLTFCPSIGILLAYFVSLNTAFADEQKAVEGLNSGDGHEFSAKFRNVYFNKTRDSSSADSTLIDQWGQAVELNYINNQFSRHLELGASAYAAVKLHGGDDNRGSDIFEKESDGSLSSGYAKLGQLYAHIKYDELNYLKLGSQVLDYNLLESSGSRATPSTFIHQAIHVGNGNWGGHLLRTDRWSPRYGNDYEKFTNNAGETISHIQIAGINYAGEQFYFLGEIGRAENYMDRQYVSTGYRFTLNQDKKLDLNIRYHASQDAGELYDSTFGGRRAGSGLDGEKLSLMADYEVGNLDLGIMLARNGKDGFDIYWYSKDHGTMRDWSFRQISEFVAANESIIHIQTKYDMKNIVPGFEWALTYTRGTGARGGEDYESNPDNDLVEGSEWEANLTLNYDFKHHGLDGLTFRYIGAYYRNSIENLEIWNNPLTRSNTDGTDNRFYLDYSIKF